jgi:RNA polymerase sigma-B factor
VGSLDSGDDADGPSAPDHQAVLATDEPGFDDTLDRHLVESSMSRLPDREKEIVHLRFHEGLSQDQIAERVGISQMHVSRLLRRSFEQMRAAIGDPPSD